MMLNVSRTPVSESWLSTLAPKPSGGYNTLDKEAFVTLEKSRFSVIDSELFPELLSWSTWMNALPHSCAQSIPSDITKPDGTDMHESIHETSTIHETNTIHEANTMHDSDTAHEADTMDLSSILDPTTLEIGFDWSCLEGLDDFLIHDPLEAFSEACWSEAIEQNEPAPSTRIATPTRLLHKPAGPRKLPSPPVARQIAEEYDGDASEILKSYREEEPTSPSIGNEVTFSASSLPEQKSPWSKRDTGFYTISDDDEATSFIIFEAPPYTPNRYDSIGHFPVPSSRPHRTAVSRRIPTFCPNLPAPFTSVR